MCGGMVASDGLPEFPAASARPAVTGTAPVEVIAENDEARLDRFLADRIPDISRSRLHALIEAGQVSMEGAAVRTASTRIRAGSRLLVTLPDPVAAQPQPEHIALDILYEDADLIVLDKPVGLVVHPAPGSLSGTLVNALLAHCGDSLPGIGGERRPGIVHRLDKDTSGLMVVAKSELAMARLGADFAARRIDRAYSAISWGLPAPLTGEIAGDIGRDPRDRKRMAIVTRGGKAALTRYVVKRQWMGAVSLLECRLATGRTHQIRVHLASKGHHLVGDPVYLRRVPAVAKLLPAAIRGTLLDFPHQALHAARLGFVHPLSGAEMAFDRAPPNDCRVLDRTALVLYQSRCSERRVSRSGPPCGDGLPKSGGSSPGRDGANRHLRPIRRNCFVLSLV
jgi:23S rRNA pseudouridine1911/1915/1917 synthase